jgi:hypothetical protein
MEDLPGVDIYFPASEQWPAERAGRCVRSWLAADLADGPELAESLAELTPGRQRESLL